VSEVAGCVVPKADMLGVTVLSVEDAEVHFAEFELTRQNTM
jgi:hypothetical protein